MLSLRLSEEQSHDLREIVYEHISTIDQYKARFVPPMLSRGLSGDLSHERCGQNRAGLHMYTLQLRLN